jgi:hypothetical protein
MKIALVWSVLVLVLSGCIQKKKDDDILPYRPGPSAAFSYDLANPGCQSGAGVDKIENASVTSVVDGRPGANIMQADQIKGNPLASRNVSTTQYDIEMRFSCEGQASCVKGYMPRMPKNLKICDANPKYKRDNVEGIAITSLFHLQKVFDFYSSIDVAKTLQPIKLLVLPIVVRNYGSKQTIDADNLSYTVFNKSEPSVVVYPKSKVGATYWPDINLWESPWILAHEGSHHIFQTEKNGLNTTLAGNALDFPILSWPKNGPDHEHDLLLAGERTIDEKMVESAVNEGFADLFGFYAIGEDVRVFKDFPCFETNRNVASDVLAGGIGKVLNQHALADFFSPSEIAPISIAGQLPCDAPDFQDVHVIGAVVAHGLDQVFSRNPTVERSSNKIEEKARMAILWARALGRIQSTQTPQELLQAYVEAGIEIARDSRLTFAQCKAIERNFPLYHKDISDCH